MIKTVRGPIVDTLLSEPIGKSKKGKHKGWKEG